MFYWFSLPSIKIKTKKAPPKLKKKFKKLHMVFCSKTLLDVRTGSLPMVGICHAIEQELKGTNSLYV